jgi:hypothetical protein
MVFLDFYDSVLMMNDVVVSTCILLNFNSYHICHVLPCAYKNSLIGYQIQISVPLTCLTFCAMAVLLGFA